MASTYSALKVELIGTGQQSGTWGATTDTNLDVALGEAITGSADVAFTSAADVTVTLTDTNTAQTARNLRLNLTESGAGVGFAGNLVLGSGCQIEKLYLINNGTTAAKTIKNTTGTGVSVPAGKSMFVFNNGTNVVDAVNYVTTAVSATTSTNIAGGSANVIPYQTGSGATSFLPAGTAGQVLTSGGSGSAPSWSTGGAASSLVTTNFSIVESGGKLLFKYGATTIASMNSSGELITLGSNTAGGTP
jgi:hypothetical protein